MVDGLILIGGQSKRMGADKSILVYHGLNQRQYLQKLLEEYCMNVYISCNAQQSEALSANTNLIIDRYHQIGPMAALLSAFDFKADVAWLVIACDMPFVRKDTIQQLLTARDERKFATAFENLETGKPEPLLAIWEPASREHLIEAHAREAYSIQKLLMKMDIKTLWPTEHRSLLNANDRAAFQKYYRQINSEKK